MKINLNIVLGKFVFLLTLFFASSVFSQPSAPSMQPAEYNIRFTPQEVNIVGAALFERPYREVAPLITKLQQQLDQQNKAVEQPKEEPQK